MKIYIIPTGWDRELVIKSAFKSGADKVCLVSAYPKKSHSYSKSDIITKKVNQYIIKEISKFTNVETLEVNYIDFKDIIIQIDKYIRQNEGNEFLINISTGSHLLAATLMFVAYMNNLTINYSIAKSHNQKIMKLIDEGEDLHSGFSDLLELPSFPFSLKFSQKERLLLNKLKNNKVMNVADFIKGSTGNAENRMRSEFHYTCKKLEKQGILEFRNKGKKIEVKLTHFGEICAEH